MKFLAYLLFNLVASVNLHSQNCKALESEQFFKTIKLGAQIPIELTECLRNVKIEYPYYNDYRVSPDNLSQTCRKKYIDIFKFQSIPFSYLLISTNKKGQIIHIELYIFFENDRKDSSLPKPPANFTRLLNNLKSLYGDPTRIKEATDQDSLLVKELGLPRTIIWECNKVSLQLRVNYGSNKKELNVIDIQIRNESIDQIELLQ